MADPYLFNNAFGGGLSTGSAIGKLFQDRQQRRQLSDLAQLIGQGNYQQAGAGLIGLGQVGAGVDVMQMPLKQRIAENKLQGGGVTYGKSPVYVRRPDGSLGIGVLGDDGNFKPIEGVNPAENLTKVDFGTATGLVGTRTGQQVGDTFDKDVATPAYQETAAREQAKLATEAQAEFAELDTKMAGLRDVVGQLYTLSDAATYTKAGQAYDEVRKQLGYEPTAGALARTKYMAMVDNQVLPLLKQTFGAAFTVQEGESLRATLGDPDKSPAEKKAVLDAFIAQKERDLRAMGAKAFSVQPGPTQAKGISQGDYDSLPSGAVFEHNGKKYRKP